MELPEWDNPPVVVNALVTATVGGRDCALVGIRNLENGKGKYELVGGFVEIGETLEEALQREVREETECEVIRLAYFGSYVGTYSDGRKVLSVVFHCLLNGIPKPTQEIKSYGWVDKIPENMFADCDAAALKDYFQVIEVVDVEYEVRK